MKNPFKKERSKEFNDLITATKAEMQTYGPGTPEWEKGMNDLKSLTAMRELTITDNISPDMAVLCATHTLGVLLMGWFEVTQGHIIPQKTMSLLPKLRN